MTPKPPILTEKHLACENTGGSKLVPAGQLSFHRAQRLSADIVEQPQQINPCIHLSTIGFRKQSTAYKYHPIYPRTPLFPCSQEISR
ncbi:hypothetical protein HZ326_8474 [Fusarium oxysporum f. sp. albedinis]|nr:hypothetical protein HZ326_8474 [Fusarium oxysporum f. sp. albedinis]